MLQLYTVLVVDDDRPLVTMIEEALEDAGYAVLDTVGAEAVLIARAFRPDVILLDLVMPGMDGIEISHRLRAEPVTAAIPIVAMSAPEQFRAVTTRLPVDDRLLKPFNLDCLYAAVARWATTKGMSWPHSDHQAL